MKQRKTERSVENQYFRNAINLEMRHCTELIESLDLFIRQNPIVAKIQHKRITLPSKNKFYLDSVEAHGVQDDVCAYAERVRGPALERLEVVDF